MKIELTEQQLQNLMAFLNRVEYKGLQEAQAINEIMTVLSNPIETENSNEELNN